jgi:protocatechuate 3,4-dioxygenase beta subunit
VRDAASCEPVENAVVDIWHCDASGVYSGFESASTGAGGAPAGAGGHGRADLPARRAGHERGRHRRPAPRDLRGLVPRSHGPIHAKVHRDRGTALTSQLFLADDITERVHVRPPYGEDGGRDTTNADDGIHRRDPELTLREQDGGVLGPMTFDVRRG